MWFSEIQKFKQILQNYLLAGILIGSLTAEYGGMVNITCEKTGYNAEIEFKLKVIVAFFLPKKKDCCVKVFIQSWSVSVNDSLVT